MSIFWNTWRKRTFSQRLSVYFDAFHSIAFFFFSRSLHCCNVFFIEQNKVRPWSLYVLVALLLAIDLTLLLVWQLTDPLQRQLETFPLEKPLLSTDDIRISPGLEHCESENQSVWLGRFHLVVSPFPFHQKKKKKTANFVWPNFTSIHLNLAFHLHRQV